MTERKSKISCKRSDSFISLYGYLELYRSMINVGLGRDRAILHEKKSLARRYLFDYDED